jgi:F0F1-type ATP synthase assembly protein I
MPASLTNVLLSDDLSQGSPVNPRHRKAVDPAARSGKKLYEGMSSSSIGLELGISVILGVLGGLWADDHFGTQPWLMLAGIALGCTAGFRSLMRAVAKEDRRGARDDAERAAIADADKKEASGK